MKVYIITEGGKTIGFGHLTRSISLYEAFKERKIMPEFIVNGDDSIESFLKEKKYQIFNWLKKKNKLFELVDNADICIIDSYLAGSSFYKSLSRLVKTLVYIDDNKRLDYPRGIVINGNILAEELDYPKKNGTVYLLGIRYTLLRKPFWEVSRKIIKAKIKSVMITFGGNDAKNMTPKISNFLNKAFPGLIKNVIIGIGFKKTKAIEKIKDKNTNLIFYPYVNKIKEIMLESDIAISAAGQTLYELVKIGVPTIAIAVAKNQLYNVEAWRGVKVIEYAGWWEDRNLTSKVYKCIMRLEDKRDRLKRYHFARSLFVSCGARKVTEFIINQVR